MSDRMAWWEILIEFHSSVDVNYYKSHSNLINGGSLYETLAECQQSMTDRAINSTEKKLNCVSRRRRSLFSNSRDVACVKFNCCH